MVVVRSWNVDTVFESHLICQIVMLVDSYAEIVYIDYALDYDL